MNNEPQLTTYLLESYSCVPNDAAVDALRQAAARYGSNYLRTIRVPADETCFHLIASTSVGAALRVAKAACVDVSRICEARELVPSAEEGDVRGGQPKEDA